MTIMVGGFGLSGNPEALIRGVVERDVRDLTLVSNNAGNLGKGLATWLKAGLIKKVICSYIGSNEELHTRMASGEVKVEITPQGTLAERMRAAGAGIPAFFTPTGVGTVVEDGKESARDRRPPLHPRARAPRRRRARPRRQVRSLRQPPVLADREELQPGDGDRRQARRSSSATSSSPTARSIPTTFISRASTSTRSSTCPSTRTRSSTRRRGSAHDRADHHDHRLGHRRHGAPRRARNPRGLDRQPRHRPADAGRRLPPRGPCVAPLRERPPRHGPVPLRGRRGSEPHQRGQADRHGPPRRLDVR